MVVHARPFGAGTFCKTSSLCVALALGGCHSPQASQAQASLGAINDHCPVLGFKAVNAEAPTTMYKGHVIGFCCSDCPKSWDKWSEEKKDAFVAGQLADKPSRN